MLELDKVGGRLLGQPAVLKLAGPAAQAPQHHCFATPEVSILKLGVAALQMTKHHRLTALLLQRRRLRTWLWSGATAASSTQMAQTLWLLPTAARPPSCSAGRLQVRGTHVVLWSDWEGCLLPLTCRPLELTMTYQAPVIYNSNLAVRQTMRLSLCCCCHCNVMVMIACLHAA